jgi:hypothetical protein
MMLSAEGQRSRSVSQLDEVRAVSSLHRLATSLWEAPRQSTRGRPKGDPGLPNHRAIMGL